MDTITPARTHRFLPAALSRTIQSRRNRRAGNNPRPVATTGDLLELLDRAYMRRAIPDVDARITLAKAIRDRDDAFRAEVSRWVGTGQVGLLAAGVTAGADTDTLRAHRRGYRRLDLAAR